MSVSSTDAIWLMRDRDPSLRWGDTEGIAPLIAAWDIWAVPSVILS
jgi:hypothetical protein